jgi:hypothetical protein
VGDGSTGDIVAWSDGDAVALGTDVLGKPGIRIDVVVAGLDSTEQASAVVDLTVGGVAETFIGRVPLDCFGEGPATGLTFAALPEGAPDTPGTDITMRVTLTDARGVSATDDVGLVLQ